MFEVASKSDRSSYQYVISQINNPVSIDIALRNSYPDITHSTIRLGAVAVSASHAWSCSNYFPEIATSKLIDVMSAAWLVVNGHLKRCLEHPVPVPSAVWRLIQELLPLWSPSSEQSPSPTHTPFLCKLSLHNVSITSAHLCERVAILVGMVVTGRSFIGVNRVDGSSTDIKLRQLRWTMVSSRLVCLDVDVACGVRCSVALTVQACVSRLSSRGWLLHPRSRFPGSLEILKHSPYGFKFNEMLTARLGWALRSALLAVAKAYGYVDVAMADISVLLRSFTGCLGLSMQLVLVITSFASSQCTSHSSTKCSRAFTMRKCRPWCRSYTFQEKKKHILRNRVDTLECNHRQLFSGIIICSPSSFFASVHSPATTFFSLRCN
jgi:hypothetical protein